MTSRRRDPQRDGMVLLCTLHWPEIRRYYLSRRHPGRWDFWVLPPGETMAQHVVGKFADPETSERQLGVEFLGYYLKFANAGQTPGHKPEPALLDDDDLLYLLAVHAEEGVQ